MSKECPCHYCANRKNGCHDTCPDYKAWCRENKEWKAFIKRKQYEESLNIKHTKENNGEI